MKNVYNFITIILVCTYFCITSRAIEIKKPVVPTKNISSAYVATNNKLTEEPIVQSSKKTYKQLRDDIAAMKPHMVIAPDGILTDYFINFVQNSAKKSEMSDLFIKALLEAGMSLHAQFNENNTFALRTIQRNSQQIKTMTSAPSAEPIQQKSPQPIKPKNESPQPFFSEPKKPHKEPDTKPVKNTPPLSGPAGLKEFRKQSLNQPLEAFYANSTVNPQWLHKALQIVLASQPLTSHNKEQIQRELLGNATELMRELLHKNHIAGTAWNTFLENVEKQVITFINNQPLANQKQLPAPIAPKKPHTEPSTDYAKIPSLEPEQKTAQKPDIDHNLPQWISSDYTLISKDFEIEMLNYIFKNQHAHEENILNHFIAQLPQNMKNRDSIIKAIKIIIKSALQEPDKPSKSAETGAQRPTAATISPKNLPNWIDHERFDIIRTALIHEIMNYFSKNSDADNDTILNYFINQLPPHMPDLKFIKVQIRAIIDTVFTE